MIPYDDLVAALTAWRARQGLPVAGSATAGSGPTAVPQMPGSGPTKLPGSGPTAKPGSGPTTKPPSGPVKHGMYQPPPLQSAETMEDSLDVGDDALLEEQYENEGDDFAMNFGGSVEQDAESTTLGQAPERDSFGGSTEFDPPSKQNKKPW